MRTDSSRVWRHVGLFMLALTVSCGKGNDGDARPAPVLPPVSGTVTVSGLSAPVTVVRDRQGIPHITASSTDDLFFAQGFVQAQDRLFQMDLWRRSVQGRLSEVLGSNFFVRDTMTRRIQYRGDVTADWASYGADTQAIATAFVRGINAWIEQVTANPPEEFRLAGWLPEPWRAEDLLNRTDAFLSSQAALEEILRAQLTATLGVARVDALLPPPSGLRTEPSAGVDVSAIGRGVSDAIRRVGTRPFFLGLMAPIPGSVEPSRRRATGSNAWAVDGARTATAAPLVAVDPHRAFDHPSARYLVHLSAPGWNVIGATAPWLPGVVIGHNDSVAWGMASTDVDVQDVFVEHLAPADDTRIEDRGRLVPLTIEQDALSVKGQKERWDFERQYTPRGVLIGVDRERRLGYALRWIGTEPGTASELGALALDRARSVDEFRGALARWKSPAADFVYADREGHIGKTRAALVPVRRGSNGLLPASGWNASAEWSGFVNALTSGPDGDPAGAAVAANDAEPRLMRIREQLRAALHLTVEQMKVLQLDTHSWNASQLVPLLAPLTSESPSIEAMRQRLLAWDGNMVADSADAALYASWERALRTLVAERRIPAMFVSEVAERLSLVRAFRQPAAAWFDGRPGPARAALLLDAFSRVERETQNRTATGPVAWGDVHRVTFVHPLSVGEAGRRRFNVGPFALPGAADTVFATSVDGTTGPSFRAVFDLADWDRSVATNAPGQSGSPGSPHFADLATMWTANEYFGLPFTEPAVRAATESVLTLAPPR